MLLKRGSRYVAATMSVPSVVITADSSIDTPTAANFRQVSNDMYLTFREDRLRNISDALNEINLENKNILNF